MAFARLFGISFDRIVIFLGAYDFTCVHCRSLLMFASKHGVEILYF